MPQNPFGGDPTERKLVVIEKYLKAYQQALKFQRFRRIYIDAFAGTGEIPRKLPEDFSKEAHHRLFNDEIFRDEEKTQIIKGSAVRAMDVEPPFDEYVFVDAKRKNIEELRDRVGNHPNAGRCTFIPTDANQALLEICGRYDWKSTRAVVFLDPFGNQVAWETIEKLAGTKAVDLWYLFPSGLGVFRQIGKHGTIDPTHEASINRLLGTDLWKEAFIKPREDDDLFGRADKLEKLVTPESAAEFMQDRLRSVFRGGVLDEKIALGKHAYPSFHLLFAWANDSVKAHALARSIARDVMKATK